MESRINYLLLATALLGTFFSGTATRIVSISMPTVAQSLGTDLLGVSWALLSYQLSNIVCRSCSGEFQICGPGRCSRSAFLSSP